MDTVDQTAVLGEGRTWDQSTFTWDSPDALKDWSTSAISTFTCRVDAEFALRDVCANRAATQRFTVTHFADAHFAEVGSLHTVPLGIAETYVDFISWLNAILERISLAPGVENGLDLPQVEAIHVDPRSSRGARSARTEPLVLVEQLGRAWVVFNRMAETLGIGDHRAAQADKPTRERLVIYDRVLRHANAVMFDLLVRSGAMSVDSMRGLAAKLSPVGFDEFKEFFVGDHTYEEAIVGVTVTQDALSDYRAAIASLVVNVDVPEVTETGTIEVGTGGAAVVFTKVFHTAHPEVGVTLRAGSTAIMAETDDISATGFTVRLFADAAKTIPATGTVSWSAFGY